MHLWRCCAPDYLPADLQDGIQHVVVKILYGLLPQPLGVGVRLNQDAFSLSMGFFQQRCPLVLHLFLRLCDDSGRFFIGACQPLLQFGAQLCCLLPIPSYLAGQPFLLGRACFHPTHHWPEEKVVQQRSQR